MRTVNIPVSGTGAKEEHAELFLLSSEIGISRFQAIMRTIFAAIFSALRASGSCVSG
jgi:hypothetical protein